MHIRNTVKRCVAGVVLMLTLLACGVNAKTVKRIHMLEDGVDKPTTIEELETAITRYERRVEDIVIDQQQIGIWYKMLASRYLDEKMYAECLKTCQKGLEYYPTNQNLYFYVGLCADQMGKAALDFAATGSLAEKYNYFKLSESAYLRALQLQPRYGNALFGIGSLYVFDLEEPEKAIPYLETLLTVNAKHTDGMFLLARAYYSLLQFDRAIDVYDRLITIAQSSEIRAQAESNRQEAVLQRSGA